MGEEAATITVAVGDPGGCCTCAWLWCDPAPTGEDLPSHSERGGVLEKLIYVLWKGPQRSIESFRSEMLGPVSSRLIELGARGLSVNLADEQAAYAQGLRITRMEEPISGTLSIWLDTALDRGPVEELLSSAAPRIAGYLALESVPIVNTTCPVAVGERTPGICTVAFLEKPERLAYEEWLDLWQGHHTRVAIETQSTFLYIQNAIARPLTEGAPPWTAIVEEGFPAEAATDPMVFYDAGGSQEKLEHNRRRMIESCQRFIDFERIESHPMSAYVLLR
jgi:hypothetical protein